MTASDKIAAWSKRALSATRAAIARLTLPDRSALLALFESLSKRDLAISRATAASALFCAVVCIMGFLAIIMAQALSAADEERNARVELLASLQHERRDRPGAAQESGETDHADPFVAGASETLAAAEVDNLLRRGVADSNGAVLSSRAEARHAEVGPIRRIEAEIVIEGRIEAIQAALFAFETMTPFVFIEDFSMHPVAEGADKSGSDQAPLLRATITANAYWKGSHDAL